MKTSRCHLGTERGASVVEFGLLIGLIAVVSVVGLNKFGTKRKCDMCRTNICGFQGTTHWLASFICEGRESYSDIAKRSFYQMCEREEAQEAGFVDRACGW